MRHLAEFPDHGRHHIIRALRPGKLISRRKEVAFETFRVGIQIGNEGSVGGRRLQKVLLRPQAGVLHRLGNIKDGEPLWNHDFTVVNIAMRQAIKNSSRVGRPLKQVLAGLERTPGMQVVPEHKDIRAPDHPRRLQFPGDAPRRISRA
jgi:hypothetical protein